MWEDILIANATSTLILAIESRKSSSKVRRIALKVFQKIWEHYGAQQDFKAVVSEVQK